MLARDRIINILDEIKSFGKQTEKDIIQKDVSLDDLNDKPENDLPDELVSRSRTIITACQGGAMGALAAHALKRRGYHNVFYLEGGTQGWLDAGFATAR